jgi:hypothetical protein
MIKGVNDRYPHKKATKIAIQTLKESLGDILEVNLLVLFCNKSNLGRALCLKQLELAIVLTALCFHILCYIESLVVHFLCGYGT